MNGTTSLSKSDFKIAQSCATKLFYKKHGYPMSTEENEYLLMLADGGYMVGKMAQLLYEGGIEVTTDNGTEKAIEETEELLKQDNVTLFEPAIYSNNKLVRIDILEKRGHIFRIIEVKSKSFDSIEYQEANALNKKYFESSEWQEYIEDVAFQKYVLQEKYPNATVEAYLYLPDKSKTTQIEGLIDWFRLQKPEIIGKTRFRKTEVIFNGNLDELKKGHILELVNVDKYVNNNLPSIISNSKIYIDSLLKGTKINVPISANCKKCEFTIPNTHSSKSGFQECWVELADIKPHILDLGYLGNFNRSKEKHIDNLIKQKKVLLTDVPLDIIKNKYKNRPFYQVTKDTEFLLNEFKDELSKIHYPIYFIDFETSQMAIPYHANMRPYGKIIFQWSCHVIEKPGESPKHYEWLNCEDKFPNFKFAEALRNTIKDNGTIMIWSLYENTMLKEIFQSFEDMNYGNSDLRNWLIETIRFSKDDETRFIDMNDLTQKYYFHPLMGGRTSIKVTLPAVLKSSKLEIIKHYLLEAGLYKIDDDGNIMDPYKLLPKLEIDGIVLDVSNGTDAMMAYQEMLYGMNKNNLQFKDSIQKLLLEYCRLDTLAMVIIWEHWNNLVRNDFLAV